MADTITFRPDDDAAHAIEVFKQGHPGATCWISGPTPNVR